jgi:UDPglucose 6-dehydrogenase
MNDRKIVVNKSTVPVGTAEKVWTTIQSVLIERGVFHSVHVASNPEFLKEGAAIDDFMHPDRIVVGIGEGDNYTRNMMESLYKPFVLNGHPVIFMDILSAEMTKYAANAMLATRISFMNDLANLCSLLGANINNVRKGIGSDSRIGNKFLYAGIGYGGSCVKGDTGIKTSENVLKFEKLREKFSKGEKFSIFSTDSTIKIRNIKEVLTVTEREYSGEMIRLSWIDSDDEKKIFECTEDHIQPVERNGSLILVKAKEILKSDKLYIE